MAEPEEVELKDNAMAQEFLSAYLYGLYTLKGGRMSPAESIEYVMSFAAMAEKASSIGKTVMSKMKG